MTFRKITCEIFGHVPEDHLRSYSDKICARCGARGRTFASRAGPRIWWDRDSSCETIATILGGIGVVAIILLLALLLK